MQTNPPDAKPTEESGTAATDTDALLLYNIVRTHSSLTPYVDRGLRGLNLTGAQFNALIVLRDAGAAGLPLSEIGKRLVVSKANITGLIDRLERESLVQRDSHSDRRVTLAKITDAGTALLGAALPRHRQVLTELLDGLTEPEKQQMIGLLTKLRRGIRENQNKENP